MASVAKVEWTTRGVVKTAWVVRYKDGGGVRRQRKCLSKKGADAFRLKVETEIEAGEHVADRETVTVRRLGEAYLEHFETKLRDGRIGMSRFTRVKQDMGRHFVPRLGAIKLSELKREDVERFYSEMIASGKCVPHTAKARVIQLQMMQEYAIKRKWMSKRPVSEFMKELKGVRSAPIRTFTKEEAHRLFLAARERPRMSRPRSTSMLECIVHLAAFCGLRFGEITALTLDTVDTDSRLIRVRSSICRFVGRKDPKTRAGVRDVPIPAHLVPMLRDFVEKFYVENDKRFVFTTATTQRPLSHMHFHKQMWVRLLNRAGLDRLHFHALRHYAASMMVEHGVPLTDIAALLGHASYDMTLQVYAHPMLGDQRRREAMDRIAIAVLSAPLTIEGTIAA